MAGRACRLAAVAAVLALCGLTATAYAEDPPYVEWNPALPGFPIGYAPSQETECLHGGEDCIERTLGEMYRRFDRLYPSCDHNAVFALVYIRVTEGIRTAVDQGLYEEPKFLNHEDAVFAQMYFRSFDNWKRGNRAALPPAWREALDTGRDRTASGMGNLLMNMNAHINRDMPFMLARLGLTMSSGKSRKADHDRGNVVLNGLYDSVIEEVAQRWDSRARNTNFLPGTEADGATLVQILQGWREQVWRHAELLAQASTPAQKRLVGNYIEGYALNQARMLERATELETPEPDSARRNAECAEYQRTHRERGALARARPVRGKLRARRGRVRVQLACPAGIRWCDGQLRLRRIRKGRPDKPLAGRGFAAIAPGSRATVRLRLRRSTRRWLRKHKRLRARVVVETATPWGLEVSSRRKARLRRVG